MISNFTFQISDFRTAISDFGYRILDFRRQRRRSGVSIIEVLFAILITTVGLFGAIAVFPFASAQARRSRIYDMMAAAGRSAFHDFDVRGMRRPEMWVAWDQPSQAFVPFLNLSNRQPAESFCIDPRMIAAHTRYPTGGFPHLDPSRSPDPINPATLSADFGGQCVQYFPYTEPFTDGSKDSFFNGGEGSIDLNKNGTFDPPQFRPSYSPAFDASLMRRLTLREGSNPGLASYLLPMSLAQANSIFLVDDDLNYDRPTDDKSLPASQFSSTLPSAPANAWGRRQTEGKISWFATLVPRFDVSGVPSEEYVLSIVMLHERANDLGRVDHLRERVVSGIWQDPSAATGGEIKLRIADSSEESREQLKLRPGDWVLVSGSSVVAQLGGVVVTRFQWYRVSDTDQDHSEEVDNMGTATGNRELYATLVGQDWNTHFVSPTATVPNEVRVTIVQGAFAVYEKTIRLDTGSTF